MSDGNLLKEYDEIAKKISRLQDRKKELIDELTADIEKIGCPITGSGWIAHMIDGRAKITKEARLNLAEYTTRGAPSLNNRENRMSEQKKECPKCGKMVNADELAPINWFAPGSEWACYDCAVKYAAD